MAEESTLRMAVKKKIAGGNLRSKAKAKSGVGLQHPTLDDPTAALRQPYIPPASTDRFQFLKRFSRVPGLRAKGAAAAEQG